MGTLSNLTFANGVWTTTYRITAPGGSWNAPDNGTYTVSMEPSQVADNAGHSCRRACWDSSWCSSEIGAHHRDARGRAGVTSGGGTAYWFKVAYNDDVAVNYTTIGTGDVQVTGPLGFSALGSLSNLTFSGGTWTTTYRITPPGGSWDAADNGTYLINMLANQVTDTSGKSCPRAGSAASW